MVVVDVDSLFELTIDTDGFPLEFITTLCGGCDFVGLDSFLTAALTVLAVDAAVLDNTRTYCNPGLPGIWIACMAPDDCNFNIC